MDRMLHVVNASQKTNVHERSRSKHMKQVHHHREKKEVMVCAIELETENARRDIVKVPHVVELWNPDHSERHTRVNCIIGFGLSVVINYGLDETVEARNL